MDYCFDCRTPLLPTDGKHWFAGWGYYVVFCPICCPRHYDGWDCEEDHPECLLTATGTTLATSAGDTSSSDETSSAAACVVVESGSRPTTSGVGWMFRNNGLMSVMALPFARNVMTK